MSNREYKKKKDYAVNNKDIGFSGGKCDVRLTTEENNMLDDLASRNNVSRSEIIRKALKDFYRWNSEEE